MWSEDDNKILGLWSTLVSCHLNSLKVDFLPLAKEEEQSFHEFLFANRIYFKSRNT